MHPQSSATHPVPQKCLILRSLLQIRKAHLRHGISYETRTRRFWSWKGLTPEFYYPICNKRLKPRAWRGHSVWHVTHFIGFHSLSESIHLGQANKCRSATFLYKMVYFSCIYARKRLHNMCLFNHKMTFHFLPLTAPNLFYLKLFTKEVESPKLLLTNPCCTVCISCL